jgi:hypothetical protein
MRLQRADLHELHYITPIANLRSILELGILSHDQAKSLPHHTVASVEVQSIRSSKSVPNGLRLHQYANLYIHARNAMMYSRKEAHQELCVLRVSPEVLDLPGVVIADGNAASGMTRFGPAPHGLTLIDRDLVFAEWWSGSWEAKRVRCAEVLVPGNVPPSFILAAYVSCGPAQARCAALGLTEPDLPATIDAHLFYR